MAKTGILAAVCLVAAAAAAQTAADPQQKRAEELERRVEQLEQQVQQQKPVEKDSSELRLPVSGYMDFHFNKPRGGPGILDFHRFVLLFGHSFSDRIKFWSEVELEHVLVEGREEKGELELEQAYLDFLVKPYLNFRGGMVLAPVGLINERHEPPAFNGVERPFVDTVILPSTWFEAGVGVHGDLGHGFVYKLYLMAPLDAAEFSAEEGLREGRQKGFESSFRNPAQTGRLEYHGVRRLSLGASFFTGNSGFNVPGVNPRVNVVEVDGRYRIDRFDLRAQFANVGIGKAGDLSRALQLEGGVNPNIASRLRGFYVEPGVRVLPRSSKHDLVLFARYENFDTQNKMPAGSQPLKQFDRSAWVVGATYYPEPDVALKFDYSFLRNESRVVRAVNSLNFGIGWWF